MRKGGHVPIQIHDIKVGGCGEVNGNGDLVEENRDIAIPHWHGSEDGKGNVQVHFDAVTGSEILAIHCGLLEMIVPREFGLVICGSELIDCGSNLIGGCPLNENLGDFIPTVYAVTAIAERAVANHVGKDTIRESLFCNVGIGAAMGTVTHR